jgi:hypothetical protein
MVSPPNRTVSGTDPLGAQPIVGRQGVSFSSGGNNPQSRVVASSSIVRGTVILSYQSLGYYQLATDFGTIYAFYHGASRGRMGTMEASGFLPGQQVWVAVTQNLPNLNSFILGAADYIEAGAYQEPQAFLVYPQVSGFDVTQVRDEDTDAVSAEGALMSGPLYLKSPNPKNHTSGKVDTVDGDWVMHNRLGGGVGVEMFRSFLEGSPMSGVYCYSDDDRLRIVAGRYQFVTLGSEDEDKQAGNSIHRIHRRVNYPMDAIYENVPQVFRLEGPIFGGTQEFTSYREKDNLEGAPNETQRIALLHEYRGLDGTYILSSAASITIQKRVGVRVPIEILEPGPPETNGQEESAIGPCGLAAPEYDNIQSPQNTGAEYSAATEAIGTRMYQSPAVKSPLANAMQVRQAADYILDWQARTGLDLLTAQWKTGNKPEDVFGSGGQTDQFFDGDPTMWKCMPQYAELNLDPYTATKKYYLGRACISVTEDGGIVLQDAYGSQLMMSGGNIYLSANHDIVNVPGRNFVTLAGRDAAIRGGRHVDITAEEGRLTATAAKQATLSGGLAGSGGVLIEGRGDLGEVVDGGENPGSTGGITLRSNNDVSVVGTKVTIDARAKGWSARSGGGSVHIASGDQITFKTNEGRTYGAIGAEFIMKCESESFVLGKKCILPNLELVGNFFYRKLLFISEGQNSGYYTSKILDRLNEYLTDAYDFDTYSGTLKAKYLTSKQYNLFSAAAYTIPEPEWQIRALDLYGESSSLLQSAMTNSLWEGTSPLPGTARWDGESVAVVTGTSSEYIGDTGFVTPGTVSEVTLVPSSNLRKGI